MLLKDISFNDPLKNIVYDDVLLRLAEDGVSGEVLRFWESPVYFIVLGLIGKVEEDVNAESVKRHEIPVLRRSSGGGTVLQGPGSLNYSLVLSKDLRPEIADLKKSYEYILGRVCQALKTLGINAVFLPISDIALEDGLRKISGNAQKRSKKYILHHGTILYNLDVFKAAEYLQMPKSIPEYRQGRSHTDFIVNIPAAAVDIKCAILNAFDVRSSSESVSKSEEQLLEQLMVQSEKVISL